MNIEELSMEQLRSMIKRANQRLRELEKQDMNYTKEYNRVSVYAFDNEEFMDVTSNGQIKFKTTLKGRTREQILEEASKVKNFLASRGSTVTGIKKRWKKMQEKLDDTSYSLEDYLNYLSTQDDWFERGCFEYGSKRMNEWNRTVDDKELFKNTILRGLRGDWSATKVEEELFRDREKPSYDEVEDIYDEEDEGIR